MAQLIRPIRPGSRGGLRLRTPDHRDNGWRPATMDYRRLVNVDGSLAVVSGIRAGQQVSERVEFLAD